MNRFWREMPALLFLLATFGIALWVLTDDRDAIPLHFNIRGEVDSWGEAWSVVWLPLIALAYLFIYAVWGSKNVNKDIPVD